jgi:hypothetical protein
MNTPMPTHLSPSVVDLVFDGAHEARGMPQALPLLLSSFPSRSLACAFFFLSLPLFLSIASHNNEKYENYESKRNYQREKEIERERERETYHTLTTAAAQKEGPITGVDAGPDVLLVLSCVLGGVSDGVIENLFYFVFNCVLSGVVSLVFGAPLMKCLLVCSTACLRV